MEKQPFRGAIIKTNTPRKIPPNPQENIHAEVRHQQSRRAALLKSQSNAAAPT